MRQIAALARVGLIARKSPRVGGCPYSYRMSPDSHLSGSVRSAAELNGEIRALWERAGGTLTPEQRREYEVLVTAWATAVRAEQTTAEAA